jgi:hypothetical protein
VTFGKIERNEENRSGRELSEKDKRIAAYGIPLYMKWDFSLYRILI